MGHFVAMGPLTFPNFEYLDNMGLEILGYQFKSTSGCDYHLQKKLPHTCKIVNFLTADLLLAGGAKLLGKWVAERGNGVGARRVGEGVGKGGLGKGGGVRGLESIFK